MLRRTTAAALLLAVCGCTSRGPDAVPTPTPPEAPAAPRSVAAAEARSDAGFALATGETVRIDGPIYDIDVHAELRLLEVVHATKPGARRGVKMELRLVGADGRDVACSGVGQGKWEHAETLEGRGWTGFLPQGDEPEIYFDPSPHDSRVPYGWGFRVNAETIDESRARLVVSGGAIACIK